MPAAVLTDKLTKRYGRRPGITELDLEVLPGEVFGFIAPNGAGKTTTIRLLLDLLHPSSGRAEVLGLDAGPPPRAGGARRPAPRRSPPWPN
jgi:ABC-2 type transport system ATP-binding protein